MVGLRKYPPVLDEQWFGDAVDFWGGPTLEAQICSLKILLHDAEPNLLSSWQSASDKSKIDPAKIPGTLLLRDGLPIIDLTGDGLVTGVLLRGGAGPWEGGKIAEGAAADLPGRTAGGTARRRLVVFFAEAVPHV